MSDHGYVGGGPPTPVAGDVASFPSDAEYARTLAADCYHGTLSTLTASGFPFGSVVSVVLTQEGEPVTCISSMAEHTANAQRDRRASVLFTERVGEGADPLAAARLTVVGTLTPFGDVPPDVREQYLARHPGAATYIDFIDFSWWKLVPTAVRYVGGFGHMSWVQANDYQAASPDPIIPLAEGVCAHMNADHAEANLMYARYLAGLGDATSATMTGVDRRGLTLHATTPGGPRVARIGFPNPVTTAEEIRCATINLLNRARTLAGAVPTANQQSE